MTDNLVTRLRGWLDEDVPIGVIMNEAADRIAKLEAALEVCDRVLHFDLRKMITWGPDYNQAVKDAANVTRAALGGET